MSQIILDSGALIAIERNDRALWAALRIAAVTHSDVIVPSAALAQVWRGTASQALLAKALHHCVIASFDRLARAVGELCGKTKTVDICDAQVAIVAATHGDVLYTSDPKDMRTLMLALGAKLPVIIRC